MKKELCYIYAIIVLGVICTIALCGWSRANRNVRACKIANAKMEQHVAASDTLINLCIAKSDDFFDTIGNSDEYFNWVKTKQQNYVLGQS